MDLGDKIKLLRTNKNLTQEELSSKLHITRQTISKWESNKSIPDIIKVKELCQVFEISIDDFLSNTSYQKKTRKYYYVLFIIGLILFSSPFITIIFSMLIGPDSSIMPFISITAIIHQLSYVFLIAGVGFFVFERFK